MVYAYLQLIFLFKKKSKHKKDNPKKIQLISRLMGTLISN